MKEKYVSPIGSSFSEDLKRDLKDPKFRAGFDKEGVRLELALAVLRLRRKRKMSQKALAIKAKTSQSAIARIEAGGGNCTLETMSRIASALRVTAKISFV
jgi:ribosome-binding protein aMBF1 (putative translation factor)